MNATLGAKLGKRVRDEVNLMPMIISGERVGSFIVFKDDDGGRHAVRLGAVLAISDGVEGLGTTVIQLPGNRTVLVHASLDEVLTWFNQ